MEKVTYTEQEMAAVMQRALEIQAKEAAGYSGEIVAATAKDLDLDPKYLELAKAELEQEKIRATRRQRVIIGSVIAAVLAVLLSAGASYGVLSTSLAEVTNRENQLKNVLERRVMVIPEMLNTLELYAPLDKPAKDDLDAKMRDSAGSPDLAAKMAAYFQVNAAVKKQMTRLQGQKVPETFVVSLQTEIEGSINRISVELKRYNEAITAHNLKRRDFPMVLFAGWFGFPPLKEISLLEVAKTKEQ